MLITACQNMSLGWPPMKMCSWFVIRCAVVQLCTSMVEWNGKQLNLKNILWLPMSQVRLGDISSAVQPA
jgi:hypothetical protein